MNEIQKRKRTESVEPQQQSKRARLITKDFFAIQELPREILLVIFDFLDLAAWKVSRSVCHLWNETLCLYTFASKFPLKFKNCEIARRKAPMSTFRRTFSSFPVIEIQRTVSWETTEELLEFFEYIGRATIKLSLLWMEKFLMSNKPPNTLLSKFTELQEIECSAKFLLEAQIPQSIEKFRVWKIQNFMNAADMERLSKIVDEEKSSNLFIESIEFVHSPQESDLEFVKVDETLLKIARETDAEEVQILTKNYRDVECIELSDVLGFYSFIGGVNEWYIDDSNKKTFMENFQKMKHLNFLNGSDEVPGSGCFFSHIPIEHFGIREIFRRGHNTCDECFQSALKSFPNLTRFYSEFGEIDIKLLFEQKFNLQIIDIWDTDVSFEGLLQSPQEQLYKFSHLQRLCIETLDDEEDLNWKSLIEKLPEMPELKELHFHKHSNEFKVSYKLFKLCPNIEIIDLDYMYGMNLKNIVKLFKLWPQLKVFKVQVMEMKKYDSKTLIDSIAEFAKNLEILDFTIHVSYYETIEDPFHPFGGIRMCQLKDEKVPEEKYQRYAMKKIPTLKGFKKQ